MAKSAVSTSFDYCYSYRNISFQQGDLGGIDFINEWELVERPSSDVETVNGAISTFNLGADKIYNYDFYAPPQRKIAIYYNSLLQTLTTEFLETFYAKYLHQYFFKDFSLVFATVFNPLKFDEGRAREIYNDEDNGWNSVENFNKWTRLALKGKDYALTTPFYEALIADLGLDSDQISKLLFEKSFIYDMISALNGTIMAKLMQSQSYFYKCQDYCKNEELAAFQISSSFLTKDPPFASLGFGLSTEEFNTTLLGDI